ncbi:MAG TPA: hypothetical protein VGV93_03975 [Acidimicrobiales bacterium]|nr:hypothetical protein [Acidimicrobiales bacterium]
MPDELDDLTDLPPEEFVSARNDLAKRLKREGNADLAAEVSRRRKPTLSEWIADQVRRHDPDVINALRVASLNVAAAQEAVITGGDRDALRAATEQRRDALRAVARAVEQVLARNGRPKQHRDEVLRAIESGVTAEVGSGSFGIRDDLELPDRPKKGRAQRPDAAAERHAAEKRAAIEAAEARVRRAHQELETAEAALEVARRRL